ncbi:hypothetical protein LNAOJCKE_5066 [Methylorubrum aminovorans]|jgi:hypothetical protein|nr:MULTISPECIES: hypothetical protein [Methylobacteriaceae]MCG5249433.1 hypothetical protein [Methylorubrum extorquens]UGB28635.1 hypothetical protein LPC10_25315 [Methylorubrum sp. B1-46]GJE67833.1 hypothetical protein LNAOJCKE_5066 [Methylorubrum aminovorans]GMA80383.1 hypothetical protein GCM10025880_68000 [Methylorubrum aminovorans]
MQLRINIPGRMQDALKRLLVEHYKGQDPRLVWSQLVATHSPTILASGFQSITSQIQDPDFYQDNYQDDFTVNDEHEGFFRTAKGLKITRAAKKAEGKNGHTVRNNNGAVMREVLFLELIRCNFMRLNDDGSVTINIPNK